MEIQEATEEFKKLTEEYQAVMAKATADYNKIVDDATKTMESIVASATTEVEPEVEPEIIPIVFKGEDAKNFMLIVEGMEQLVAKIRGIIGG